jgi:hypothetical protein
MLVYQRVPYPWLVGMVINPCSQGLKETGPPMVAMDFRFWMCVKDSCNVLTMAHMGSPTSSQESWLITIKSKEKSHCLLDCDQVPVRMFVHPSIYITFFGGPLVPNLGQALILHCCLR